jgi:hypothetical protein
MENTYTPLSEARGAEPWLVDLTRLAEQLPAWVDVERIEVDMSALQEFCEVTRTKSLKVLGIQEREVATNIQGIDSNGVAVGSAIVEEPEHRVIQRIKNWCENNLDGGRGTDFRDLELCINFEVFRDKMEKKGLPLNKTEFWVEFINEALKKELRKIAIEKLKPQIGVGCFELVSPAIVLPAIEVLSVRDFVSSIFSENESIKWNLLGAGAGLAVGVVIVTSLFDWSLWLTAYLAAVFALKLMAVYHDVDKDDVEKRAKEVGIAINYSPVTPLTFANFEWDRMIQVRNVLRQGPLVRIAPL